MNDTQSAKSQIIEKIGSATNILVTVSKNPSVDELSAALGLTALLNKIDKHATAVVSGKIPPAIQFLKPREHFEATTDSLRDFIIALDKEKADHARIKLVDDKVHILITPYHTTITQKDLNFEQSNEYNVDLVLALNVSDKNSLDGALTSHGRILHDATVATITLGQVKSTLGDLDWHENKASSLCEMLVSLTEALKEDESLLDEQISTAFLTGIVAATERFSNTHTTSRAMTMSAQLMASGANQQLIATKLGEEEKRKIEQTAAQKAKEKFKQNSQRFNAESSEKDANKQPSGKSDRRNNTAKDEVDGAAKILAAAGLTAGAGAAVALAEKSEAQNDTSDIEIAHNEAPQEDFVAQEGEVKLPPTPPKTEEELQREEEARIAAEIEAEAEAEEAAVTATPDFAPAPQIESEILPQPVQEEGGVLPLVTPLADTTIDQQEQLAEDLAAQNSSQSANAISLDDLRQDLAQQDQVLEQELNGGSELSSMPEAAPLPSLASAPSDFIETQPVVPAYIPPMPAIIPEAAHSPQEYMEEPTFSGTLNATTEQASIDKRAELQNDRNQVILDHTAKPASQTPGPLDVPSFAPVAPINQPAPVVNPFIDPSAPSPFASFNKPDESNLPKAFGGSIPEEIEQASAAQQQQHEQSARDELSAVFANSAPQSQPEALLPPLESAPLPPQAPMQPLPPMDVPTQPGTLPSMPDFSTLPPLPQLPQFSAPQEAVQPLGGGAVPAEKLGDIFAAPAPGEVLPVAEPQPFDPTQFKIPTQQ